MENPKSTFKVRDSLDKGHFVFFTSGTNTRYSNEYLCEEENLFLSTGGTACVHYFKGPAAYSTDCYSITTEEGLLTKFLYFFLMSHLNYINESLFKGAALKHLQKQPFKELAVPVPPEHIQKQIVVILEESFAVIAMAAANAEKNLANAREMYASVVERAFAHFMGDCEMVELGKLIDTLTDYHANGSYAILKQNVELKDTEDYAWMVRSTDFENNFQNEMRYITKSAYNFLTKSRIFGGEIIMSKIGNAGKVYLMPEIFRPCSLAMNLFLIRLNEDRASNRYVYYYLKSKCGETQILSKLKGVATQTITKESVRSLRIPWLPRDIQDRLILELEQVKTETRRLESIYQQKLDSLAELKQSILQKAFSGELTKAPDRALAEAGA